MNRERIQLTLALVLAALAAFLVVRFFKDKSGVSERAFFYDLSEQKLFVAPRTAVPPIRGLNNAEEDAVRAVVISTNGIASDKTAWTIAYLEKYSPELKLQMEKAQQTGTPPDLSRAMALEHRFVRRLHDSRWFPMSSPEAEQIVSEWAVPGRDGVTPLVCTP